MTQSVIRLTRPVASVETIDFVRRRCDEMQAVLAALDHEAIAHTIEALVRVRADGGTIFTCGNGGSAGTASHLALDLQKAARSNRSTTRAVCLSDSVGLVTAWANDTDFERVFAEQLAVLANPGDALAVISVSGSSPNLIRVLEEARRIGVLTIGLLGKDGGAARRLCDHSVIVRDHDYGWVESAHVVLHHIFTYGLRDAAVAE